MVHGVRRGWTRTTAAAPLVLLAVLAGCTAQDTGDAAPPSTRGGGPGSMTEQPQGPGEAELTGARRTLTVAEARDALPTPDALGETWNVDPDRGISDWLRHDFGSDVEISSEICRSFLDDLGALDQFRSEPVQEAADFVRGGQEFYGVEIISSRSRIAPSMFASFDIRAKACPSGTVVFPDETRMDFRLTTSKGALGDDSRTVTMVRDWPGYDGDTVLVHVVRMGHTVVAVGSIAGLDEVSHEELSGRATAVLGALG